MPKIYQIESTEQDCTFQQLPLRQQKTCTGCTDNLLVTKQNVV